MQFTDKDLEDAVKIFNRAVHSGLGKQVGKSFGVDVALADDDGGSPSSDDLSTLLNQVGQAPGATPIATVPNDPQTYQLQLLGNVQTLESYIAVLTAIVLYNKHPEPYDLSDKKQAAQFIIDTANAKNFVMSGGTVKDIALYLPQLSTSNDQKTLHTSTTSIHVDLLKVLFQGLSLAAGALTELDGVLTDVVQTLDDLKLQFSSQTETFNHQISYYYFAPVEGSNPPLQQMKVRFIYLEVDLASWKVSTNKAEHKEFDFSMSITTTDSVMNNNMVSSNASAIAQSCLTLTSNDTATIQKMIGSKGIKVDT